MEKIRSIKDMHKGERATVSSIGITGAMRRRLFDIGLIENSEIECVLKSPSGDPVAYLINGALIAIRNSDAKSIQIK